VHIWWDDEVSQTWKHALPVTIKTQAMPIFDNPAVPRINVVGEAIVSLKKHTGY
jgi:hypothetical protein